MLQLHLDPGRAVCHLRLALTGLGQLRLRGGLHAFVFGLMLRTFHNKSCDPFRQEEERGRLFRIQQGLRISCVMRCLILYGILVELRGFLIMTMWS